MELRRIQRRTVTTLALAQVFSGIGNGAGLAVGTILSRELTGRTELAGLSTVSISLAGAFAAVPLATLATRVGRRRALGLGILIAMVGAACMIAAPLWGLWALIIGSFGLGFGQATNLQARFAAADLADDATRGRDLSIVMWAVTIGAVAGPNLIGVGSRIGEWIGLPALSGPFLFSLAGMVLALIILQVGLRPDPLLMAQNRAGVRQEAKRRALSAGLRAIGASRTAVVGLAAVLVAHLTMVAIMSMTPVHLSGHHGAHPGPDVLQFIGLTISLHIAGMYALSPVMGMLTDRLGRRTMVLVGQVTLMVAAAVSGLGQHHATAVVIGLILLGLGWSASVIAGSAMLTGAIAPAERVLAQGVSDTGMGAMGALGAALSGPVLAAAGFDGLAWVGFGLCLVVAVATVWKSTNPTS